MLIFNLKRVLALRGIDKPFTFLVKHGFAPSSATNILKFPPINIKVKTLEKLCFALNCTPNDLFEWRDGGEQALARDNHPLHTLRKEAVNKKISDIMQDIPLEKIGALEQYLEELKK